MQTTWELEPHKNPYAKMTNRRLFPRLVSLRVGELSHAEAIHGLLGSLWYRHYGFVLLDDSYASMRVVRMIQQHNWKLDYQCVGRGVRPKNGCSMRHYKRVQCDPWRWIQNSVDIIIDLPQWVQQDERWLLYA